MFSYKEYNPKSFMAKRILLGLTIKELAMICRCSKERLIRIESGKSKTKYRIRFVGITLDNLAKGNKDILDKFEIIDKLVEDKSIGIENLMLL